MNGFLLDWDLAPDVVDSMDFMPEMAGGFTNLLPIYTEIPEKESVFGYWEWTCDLESEDEFELYKYIKPIERIQKDNGIEIGMVLYPLPVPEPNLKTFVYFTNSCESLQPSGFTFDQYLDRLLNSRGILGWQQYICVDVNLDEGNNLNEENMSRLFTSFRKDFFNTNSNEDNILFDDQFNEF